MITKPRQILLRHKPAEDAAISESDSKSMGLLSNQTYLLIAAHCFQRSAQAAIKVIRRNVARNTTFH